MNVLLIDDHPLILAALRCVIEGLGTHVNVHGVATAQAARSALAEHGEFDLLLLDLQLGDSNGFDLLTELRGSHPALPVVVVSASDRRSDVLRAIDLGAMGFVPKCASNEVLLEALRMVMSGGIYVPPMVMRARDGTPLGAPDASRNRFDDSARIAPRASAPLASLGLTPRQTDVLALLLKGLPNKLIARELNLSVETVKDHVAAVLRTLGVSSRTQAVLAVGQMSGQGGPSAWRRSER